MTNIPVTKLPIDTSICTVMSTNLPFGIIIGYTVSFLSFFLLPNYLHIRISIRPIIVDRKNWLFSDTPIGAITNTMYLPIVKTAKEDNLDLYEYLKFLLERQPNKNINVSLLESYLAIAVV